jgi:hypothetical protein
VEGSCEHGNEPPGSIKCWEVLGVAAQLAASQEGLSSMSESGKEKEILGLRKIEISEMFRILRSKKVYGLYSAPGY